LKGALILAGGRSSRFGSDKALAVLQGRPLIAHVVRTASQVADEVVVAIGRESNSSTYRKFLPASIRIVKDRWQVKSPLVGILTGFKWMRSNYSVVLSCDTPFANRSVLGLLFKKATHFDAAIPRWPNGDIEPLQAVYRTRPAIPAAKMALTHKEFRNVDMIKRLRRITYVPVREIKQIDKDLVSFFNVNNRRDLRRAEAIQAFSRG